MAQTIVDYSAGVPSAAAVKSAGHVGAIRYLSRPRADWMLGKPISKPEVDDYHTNGMDVAFCFQYSKGDTKRGWAGGVVDAQEAQRQLEEIGRPNHPVFFTVDYDIQLSEWNERDNQYFRGAISILGRDRVGAYGHSRLVAWAREDGVIADLGGGRCLGWVTNSWGSEDFHNYAVLFQRIVDTASNPGPVIDGVTVDVNDILHNYWGQHAASEYQPPEVDVTNLPHVDRTRWMTNRFNKGRSGAKIKYIVRHHVAGFDDLDSVWNLWTYEREASAHYIADAKGHIGQLVRDEDTAWHAGHSVRNRESIGIEHTNSSGPPGWSISDVTIVAGAKLAAELCVKHGLGRPEFGVNIKDHQETFATSCPHHLANGGKYHKKWMDAAQSHYDRLIVGNTINLSKEGFLMALSDDEQRELLDKTRRVHHELTHDFQSLYVGPDGEQSAWRGTLAGILLQLDRKLEDLHANQVPWVAGRIDKIKQALTKGSK